MKVEMILSAILSENNPDYDLPLLRWKVYRLKDGRPTTQKPTFSHYGSKIKCAARTGNYLATFCLGAFIGEELITLGKESHYTAQYNLNAGILRPTIIAGPDAVYDKEDMLMLSSPVVYPKTRHIFLSTPIPCLNNSELVFPADKEFKVQGRVLTDPTNYSEEQIISLKSGEIRTMDFIADKTMVELHSR